MNKKRLTAIVMSVLMALTLLPSMVFAAAAPSGALDGKLKIKGAAAVGGTLSADYSKVQPEGVTDEYVTFQWSRKDGEQLTEVGTDKTYKVAQEDLGYPIVLTINGKEDLGLSGTLTKTSNPVAATEEEALALAAAEEGGEPPAEDPGASQEAESEPPAEEIPEIPQETGEEGGEIEEIPEAAGEEGNVEVIGGEQEPAGEGGEIEETPEAAGEEGDGEDSGAAGEGSGTEEVDGIPPATEDGEEPAAGTDAAGEGEGSEPANTEPLTFSAETFTDDGTGIVDFGTLEAGFTEAEALYAGVKNTGTGILNFRSISPEHFMVQDIEAPLNPGETVSIWIQPREGLAAGAYDDSIVYTTEEGVNVSLQAKAVVEEEELVPGDEPEGDDPDMKETGEPEGDDPDMNGSEGPEDITGPGPVISPGGEGEVNYELTASAEDVNFGSAEEGYVVDDLAGKILTVTNESSPGTEPLMLLDPVFFDENSMLTTDFTVSLVSGMNPLQSGNSVEYEVKPAAGLPAGNYFAFAEIRVENVAITTSPAFSFTVTKKPEAAVSVTADPQALTFGPVKEGETIPEAQTVTLKNEGTDAITLAQPVSADANFTVGALSGTELPVGETVTFTVAPAINTGAGTYQTDINIYSAADADNALATVSAEYTINEPDPVYTLEANPVTLSFASMQEGYETAPEAQTVTLTNKGNRALNLKQAASEYFTIGAYSGVRVEPGASATFTAAPKTGLKKGAYQEDISITTDEGAQASVSASFAVAEASVKLKAIQRPADITGLANGTKKSAEALKLPTTVVIETTGGNLNAGVKWDVKNSAYDAGSTEKQTFTVKGAVTLPEGIENPDGLNLVTAVQVTVNAYKPKVPDVSENQINGISSDGKYTTDTKITITAVGAGMNNDSPRKGDVRYVPLNWKVLETKSWGSAPYTATFRMGKAGSYTLSVVFGQQKYDGNKWADTGEQASRTVNFTVSAAAGQITVTPTPQPTNANKRNAVQTGDNTSIMPFIVILIVAILCIAGILVYRKKKK